MSEGREETSADEKDQSQGKRAGRTGNGDSTIRDQHAECGRPRRSDLTAERESNTQESREEPAGSKAEQTRRERGPRGRIWPSCSNMRRFLVGAKERGSSQRAKEPSASGLVEVQRKEKERTGGGELVAPRRHAKLLSQLTKARGEGKGILLRGVP